MTAEDVEAEISRMAEMYNMEVDKIKETLGDEANESLKQDLLNQKAYDFIVDNAEVK